MIIIFGAAGDLTKRMLIPAFWHLSRQKLLPENFGILGVAQADYSDLSFREKLRKDFQELSGIEPSPEVDAFLERVHFLGGNMDEAALYQALNGRLVELEAQHATLGNRLFYLAVLPDHFASTAAALGQAGLCHEVEGRWTRVIVEKPFGHSHESAVKLNHDLLKVLKETQIYRIDHYLGKETVQNLLAFRFGNTVFEPLWNRRYIDHVQITAAETLGVEHRGAFYEGAGALRDMMSNHLCQLLAFIAMEPPVSFDAEAVRDEKMKVVRAIQSMHPEQVLTHAVRGQYGPGTEQGSPVAGYRKEDHVNPESYRETYAAVKLCLDNWRWAGVPFYLRTGKRLARRRTEIRIVFKAPPFLLFRNTHVERLKPNTLVIQIQPEEGIQLVFGAKVPGAKVQLEDVVMDFNYAQRFGGGPQTGYETLLYDCMIGDATQFQRADMAEGTWKIMDSILGVWEALPPEDFPNYDAGSEGPEAADELMQRDGRQWSPLAG